MTFDTFGAVWGLAPMIVVCADKLGGLSRGILRSRVAPDRLAPGLENMGEAKCTIAHLLDWISTKRRFRSQSQKVSMAVRSATWGRSRTGPITSESWWRSPALLEVVGISAERRGGARVG